MASGPQVPSRIGPRLRQQEDPCGEAERSVLQREDGPHPAGSKLEATTPRAVTREGDAACGHSRAPSCNGSGGLWLRVGKAGFGGFFFLRSCARGPYESRGDVGLLLAEDPMACRLPGTGEREPGRASKPGFWRSNKCKALGPPTAARAPLPAAVGRGGGGLQASRGLN